MAWRRTSDKPLPEQMLIYYLLDPSKNFSEILIEKQNVFQKCRSHKGGYFGLRETS